MTERETRKAPLEKTINAHPGFVGGNSHRLNFAGGLQCLCVVLLRRRPEVCRLRDPHFRATVMRFAASKMPWPRHLPAAARLTWAGTSAAHAPPRSFLSFAQYSSRFLISRSKPRSGGL